MVKDLVEMKQDIKNVLMKWHGLPETSREGALVRTKLEEACMWIDYDLRLRGIDPADVEMVAEDTEEEDSDEQEFDDIVSNM